MNKKFHYELDKNQLMLIQTALYEYRYNQSSPKTIQEINNLKEYLTSQSKKGGK